MKKNNAVASAMGQLLSYMQPEVSSGNTLYYYFFSYVTTSNGKVIGYGNIGLGLMCLITHIEHIRLIEEYLAQEVGDPTLTIVVQNFHLLSTVKGADDVSSGNYTSN